MKQLITVRPTPSFALALPDGICDQRDERVSSFWFDGKPLLLQISSYSRSEGNQVTAHERLADRTAKDNQNWRLWKMKVHPDRSLDQATAEFLDEKGFLWIHSYLVWPHVTVYITVSGPAADVRLPGNWAITALQSVTPTTG